MTSNLTSPLTIPASVTSIGDGFMYGSTIHSLVLPVGNLLTIGDNFLGNCTISSVVIPEGVTTIGTNLLDSSTVSSLTVPSTVTSMGNMGCRLITGGDFILNSHIAGNNFLSYAKLSSIQLSGFTTVGNGFMSNIRQTGSQNSVTITGSFGTAEISALLVEISWLTSVTIATNSFPIVNPFWHSYNLTEVKFTYSGTVSFPAMYGTLANLQGDKAGIIYASAGTNAAINAMLSTKPPPNWTYSLYSDGGGGGGGGAGGGGGPVPCFPKGTRILTASGYKTVESLTQGELVQTADGRQVPVKLYGTYIPVTNTMTAPFKIPKGVFGVAHDLLLSPDHAFQVQKGLWMIPKYAAALSEKVEQVLVGSPMTYYHIECPQYLRDNLVVDGVVVESYAGRQLSTRRPYTYSKTLQAFTRSGAVVSKSLSL